MSETSYVDVHAHIIHEQFIGEEDVIAEKCRTEGIEYVICNGLEPASNRAVLSLCEKHPNILPACGIYPIDAACNFIVKGENWDHDFDPPAPFDVDAEIDFIDQLAEEKKIVALGECGLDKVSTEVVEFWGRLHMQ
jgi:TatD DNase family protein